jgi:hypothetical protein
MTVFSLLRPKEKVLIDPVTRRVMLEWDRFFQDVSSALLDIQKHKTFTLSAASSKTISDTRATTTSFIGLSPQNASAATLQSGAGHLYVSPADIVQGSSFTVKTADGSSAAGTEIFSYCIFG